MKSIDHETNDVQRLGPSLMMDSAGSWVYKVNVAGSGLSSSRQFFVISFISPQSTTG